MTVDLSKLSATSTTRYEYVNSKSSMAFSVLPGGFPTYTVSHNLGYKPYYRAWYTYGNGVYHELFAGFDSYDIESKGVQVAGVEMSDTAFSVTFDGATNPGTVTGTVYYRIYAEPVTA